MNIVKKDSTSVTRYVMLVDSVTGTPKTDYTITNLDLQYTRNRAAPVAKVDATSLGTTYAAWSANGAFEIDATSSPGLYRVDWPNTAFVDGVDKVVLVVSGAGLHPAVEEIQLVGYDPENGVRLGLTALPNMAAEAAGGLYTRGTGAGQINQPVNGQIDSRLVTMVNGIISTSAFAAGAIDDNAIAASAISEIQSGLSTLTQAQIRTILGINAATDVLDELGVAAPAATPKIGPALMLLYMALRNAFTASSTQETISNDAGTVVSKATVEDAAGVYTKAEFISGA